MKKLKLKLDGIGEQLTNAQMKKINGGYYSCFVVSNGGDGCPPAGQITVTCVNGETEDGCYDEIQDACEASPCCVSWQC
jgi:hypothetical protein